MKLSVRTVNARLLGNGLVAHIRKVQAYENEHRRTPQRPFLTYTGLVEETGAKLAVVGIGNFLEEIMEAIHAPGIPEAMRGLTLFVTDMSGRIDYVSDPAAWREITGRNSLQFRQAVLDHDWADVEFVTQGG